MALFLLAGCGAADEGSASETSPSSSADVSPTTEAAPTTAEIAETSTESSAPAGDEALRAAVQGYSDAFLGGDPTVAYDYFSARCRQQVSLSYFTGIVMAAGQVYGSVLPITSYQAQVAGDMARVSYTYDVAALNQTDEPWSREDGAWKQDDC
ncbi:MAG: hypothetical protein JWR85_3713 [Marmoricola sp.]|nr:hypothetical protein [Marmoricola sp.]